MRLHRSHNAASNPVPTAGETRHHRHRLAARTTGLISATTLVTAAWAMWTIPADAAVAAKVASKTTVSAPASAFVGAGVTLSATVKSTGKTPTGTVKFTSAGKTLCTGHLSGGKTHCTGKFAAAGKYTIKGSYSGDAAHNASSGTATETLKRYSTTVALTPNPKTPYPGQHVTLSATVSSASAAAATGKVTFSDASGTLCTGTLSGGKASCSHTWNAAGSDTVKASYAGDAAHNASSKTASLTVALLKTVTTITSPDPASEPAGTPFTFNVTVTSSNGSVVPSGTVHLAPTNIQNPEDNLLCTVTMVNGAGSCTVTPADGTWGFLLYEATYSGDSANAKSVSTGEHKLITPSITTTAVTPGTATAGTAVTLTAVVGDQGNTDLLTDFGGPDQVNFLVNGAAACSKVDISFTGGQDVATCSYTPPAAGNYTVEADFLGDDYNQPSSGTETLTAGS
jgi:hypothetical protein